MTVLGLIIIHSPQTEFEVNNFLTFSICRLVLHNLEMVFMAFHGLVRIGKYLLYSFCSMSMLSIVAKSLISSVADVLVILLLLVLMSVLSPVSKSLIACAFYH